MTIKTHKMKKVFTFIALALVVGLPIYSVKVTYKAKEILESREEYSKALEKSVEMNYLQLSLITDYAESGCFEKDSTLKVRLTEIADHSDTLQLMLNDITK